MQLFLYSGNGQECHREITCQDLNCHIHALCIENRRNRQARCQCLEGIYNFCFYFIYFLLRFLIIIFLGYSGDGKTCTVVPSHLSFQGYALHDEIVINPNSYPEVVKSVQAIGIILIKILRP